MSTRSRTRPIAEPAHALPIYELRVMEVGAGTTRMEIFQLPSPATPSLAAPRRIAGLVGRNLSLIEHRLLRRLAREGLDLGGLALGDERRLRLSEDTALVVGLLFRVLAPMRDRERMRACVEGIEIMGREEAAYWLGMAMHRKNPRRVLMALRFLVTDPQPGGRKAGRGG